MCQLPWLEVLACVVGVAVAVVAVFSDEVALLVTVLAADVLAEVAAALAATDVVVPVVANAMMPARPNTLEPAAMAVKMRAPWAAWR